MKLIPSVFSFPLDFFVYSPFKCNYIKQSTEGIIPQVLICPTWTVLCLSLARWGFFFFCLSSRSSFSLRSNIRTLNSQLNRESFIETLLIPKIKSTFYFTVFGFSLASASILQSNAKNANIYNNQLRTCALRKEGIDRGWLSS